MSINIFKRIGTMEALNLLRNLSMTLRAGVPLARAIALFEEDIPNGRRAVVTHLRKSVEAGRTLADAMKSSPRSFPALVVNLVRTGELSGTLQQSLEESARHLQKYQDLKRNIRSAMMYPTFVLVAVLGLGLSVGTLVLPELIPLFDSLDVELPFMTRALLVIATFFDQYGLLVVIVTAVVMALLFLLSFLESIKILIHRILLYLPYLGKMQRQAAIAQMTGTLSTLLRSGIPLQEALQATAEVITNRVFRKAFLGVIPVVQSGRTLSEGLHASRGLFPEMTITLIDIGEDTGTLTETLAYLEEYFEGEMRYAMKNLATTLEPLLLIGIGIIVGATVLAIITPIYDVTGSIR